ncbi:cip1-interacting zinc finger protein [Rhineura floridana]|uniref:cip1-interacting zinc finger protein n=1 Tax=Rhineura floridana TaxID=261503 RepID=UPI002AC84B85|nr:cip1-interacting zinc finger protein [Rhineura floridana]
MFNQQQYQQQLLQLQHLLQHQPPPPPHQASRGVTPSQQQQQQQMLNLRATSQASLLNARPMLQRALLIQQMQGNLRGFNMAAAPVLQQFFPQATRHSLLGPPPVGVSLKPTRLAFPGLPFQRQNRTFRKDFPRTPERKRETHSASSSSQVQGADETVSIVKEGSKQPDSPPPETPVESCSDGEPAAKRFRSEVEDSIPEEAICFQQADECHAGSHLEEAADSAKENLASDTSKEKNIAEELKTSEVVSSAGSLKVTIQQRSESRAISTTALKSTHWTSEMGAAETSAESALKFYCYICKTNCCNQQNFQTHMAGVQHQQRLREIQDMSNICFVSLLPMVQRPLAEKDGESPQRWCNTCQINFTGDLIKHRRTQEHKLAKRSLRPFCTVCSRYFKTPRKFVEHMKSPEHKQKAKEVRLGEKEQGGPEDSEELITVDAVGCFEDDEEEEEDEEEDVGEEGDSEVEQLDKEEPLMKQVGLKEVSLEDAGGNEEYCSDTIYGLDFLVPVAGFLCRLCHKFCHSDSAARLAHCKSLMHFENLQRFKAMRLQSALVDTSFHSQQGLDDQPTSPAAAAAAKMEGKTEMVNASKQHMVLTEVSSREEAAVKGDHSGAIATDDICGVLAIEDRGEDEKGTLSASTNDSAAAAVVAEEVPGLCPQKEEPRNETDQEATAGRVSGDEADPAANETPGSQEQEKQAEPPSQPSGEASSCHRRSARQRAR